MDIDNDNDNDNEMTSHHELLEDDDFETQLEHIHEYDNIKQLDLLRQEIIYMDLHAIEPHEGWYDDRWINIYNYSKIDWSELSNRFRDIDAFIYNTALHISRALEELLEDRCTHPNFPLSLYYTLINNIHNIWQYYNANYVDAETETTDDDMIALVSGLKRL